jgi:1-acyl-sn-glycerol-3-phosphate acyltransferase
MLRYRLIRLAMQLVRLVLLVRIDVYGRDHLPAQGPYLVTLNHMSAADTPLLLLAFPLVPWRFFAGEKWRSHPIYGPIMGWLGAIYVKRGQVDRRALKAAVDAIAIGNVFGLAPEGSRSRNGQMRLARDGAAYLASHTQVTIVPLGLINSDQLFANARRLRPTHIEVHIGEPYKLPLLAERARGRLLAAYTHLIMVRIADLLPERYHGAYAGSPALAALRAGQDPWPACLQVVER